MLRNVEILMGDPLRTVTYDGLIAEFYDDYTAQDDLQDLPI